MMPGTSNGIADHQALSKRSVIVGAFGSDRKDLGALLDDSHLRIRHASGDDDFIDQFADVDAASQITGRRFFAHGCRHLITADQSLSLWHRRCCRFVDKLTVSPMSGKTTPMRATTNRQ